MKLSFLIIVLSFSTIIFSQDTHEYAVGFNIFNSFALWENQYSEGSFDNLGIGTFITPTFRMNYNSYFFHASFMLSYFSLTGPDDLTTTFTDDDIDSGFDSYMSKNNLEIHIGYNFNNYLNIIFQSKYIYMFMKGEVDPDYKISDQVPFNYTEKGFLFGPGINLFYPSNKSNSFFSLSASYLIGDLYYRYKSHRSHYNLSNEKEFLKSELLSANISYNYHINTNWLLGVSFESDYFFKTKKVFNQKSSNDLWFLGINTNIFYYW